MKRKFLRKNLIRMAQVILAKEQFKVKPLPAALKNNIRYMLGYSFDPEGPAKSNPLNKVLHKINEEAVRDVRHIDDMVGVFVGGGKITKEMIIKYFDSYMKEAIKEIEKELKNPNKKVPGFGEGYGTGGAANKARKLKGLAVIKDPKNLKLYKAWLLDAMSLRDKAEEDTDAIITEFVNKINPPSGFTKALKPDGSGKKLEVFGEKVKLTFNFQSTGAFAGTTEYLVPGKGWRTFDRRGVEDSFYGTTNPKGKGLFHDEYVDPNEIIKEQIERSEEAANRIKDYVAVPSIGFNISLDEKEKIIKILQSGKTYGFEPSGFGHAKILSTKPFRDSYGGGHVPYPSKELADFFKVPQIYVEEQERD